jgi:uncharacterized protein YdcH (DUF465 family)
MRRWLSVANQIRSQTSALDALRPWARRISGVTPGQTLIDDLKITELKRRKLMLKDEIERLRHDHAL